MAERVFITGMGIISSIGNNVDETFLSIKSLKSGIGKISFLDTRLADEIHVCEVKLSGKELFEIAEMMYRKGYTRTALLGLIAAKEAVKSSGINILADTRTGLISATTVGGMDKTEQYYFDYLKDGSNSIYAASHDAGNITEKIADELGVCGYISTVSTACSASANAIIVGAKLIKDGIADRIIAGGTDALTKFTLNGFKSLMILSKTGCKPFDEMRDGITLGEGAAFIVLESEHSVLSRNKEIICELIGYGNACDAYHQTATSPDGKGPFLAMQQALKMSGLTPSDISYINAHGTGTTNNDLSEGRAIENVFSPKIPPMSSTKAYTGHCLAASGGIEAVISSLAIQNKILIPNLNFSEKIKELSFKPITELLLNVDIKNVLSNSFGFGGNNSALLFSKVSN